MSKFLKSIVESKRGSNKEKRVGNPFITVSYQPGACGGSVIADLGAYLESNEKRKDKRWEIFDKNLLKKVVEDHGLPEKFLPYLSETTAPEINDMVEETFGVHPSRHVLVYKMNQTILHLSETGYVVIVGRGANIVTAHLSKGIHVRLIGSVDRRLDYLQEYLKIEEKEARKYIVNETNRRAKYFKKYFYKDIDDPLLYDLIINTDGLSVQDIVKGMASFIFK